MKTACTTGLSSIGPAFFAADSSPGLYRPVGVKTIAIGEEVRTVEEVYESCLIRIRFIRRTPQGRENTKVARRHIAAA